MAKSELRDRALARWHLEERRARSELLQFIPWISPSYYAPIAIEPICRVYDRILAGEQVFCCIEAPPRHGKSETIFHGCARQLKYKPETRVAYVTYSTEIAEDQSRIARERAIAAGVFLEQPKRMGKSRWDPSASVRHWQTAHGGGFLAVGRDGGLVSKGVDLFHYDDPFKNREEAESETIRDKVWEGFRGDMFTRLEPGGSIVVCHQRWNDDDLIARIMQEAETNPEFPPFERITLSAINEHGEPLWPERYGLQALAMIRAAVGEYNWWSQFQCRPRPKGGAVFGEFHRYEAPALMIQRHVVLACDPAGTAKTSADNTAIVVMAYWRAEWVSPEGIVLSSMLFGDILRCYTFQLEVPDVAAFLDVLQRHWPGAPIVIETQGGHGKDVAVMLRRINPTLRIAEITTTADKFTRAQAAAAASKQGRLRLPLRPDPAVDPPEVEKWLREHEKWDEHQWIGPYVKELERFTGVDGAKDDRADATAHGWNYADGAAYGIPSNDGLPSRRMRDLGGF